MRSISKLVLPMVVLNMGGEMMNIFQQRLRAQNIEEEKATAVLQDLIRTMYAPKFIEELFKPQDMYSGKIIREIFRKLAHSSIMRLNESSMDKLLDLITMGFKYQIVSCAQPQQMLQVTLNHLEVLKRMVSFPSKSSLIDTVVELTIAAYGQLDTLGWVQLKQNLLEFFQDQHVKISLLLQYHVQLPDGTLVLDTRGKMPIGVERPGIIRYFGLNDSQAKVVSLPMASAETVTDALTSYINFDSPMGTNIYETSPESALDPGATGFRTPAAEEAARVLDVAARSNYEASRRDRSMARSAQRGELPSRTGELETANATAGLNLLASLLGASSKEETECGGGDAGAGGEAKGRGGRGSFKINLFPDDLLGAAQAKDSEETKTNTIAIDLASSHTGCAKMLRQLDLSDDKELDGVRDWKKDVDDRQSGGGKGGATESEDDLDELLGLMDFEATTTK
ncbi:unnamed protein product [Ascophyllum nodosum]